ncbi:MAG TPA: hypothetical protein VIP70_05025 [Nitrososphaeraceae archaeon]
MPPVTGDDDGTTGYGVYGRSARVGGYGVGGDSLNGYGVIGRSKGAYGV